MSNVVRLNAVPARELPVSKKRLAMELGRSPRWVNYRMSEGLPHERDGRTGHPRFYRSQVDAWLKERAAAPKPLSPSDQIKTLTDEVAKLTARLDQLERRAA